MAWIRQAVSRAVNDQGRTIRIPVHAAEEVASIERAAVRADLDVHWASPRELYGALDDVSRATTTPERIRTLVEASQIPIPLELVVSELFNVGPEEAVVASSDQESVRTALQSLPARERLVLVRRYGLDGEAPATLEGVGEALRLTRERVRQIQVEAHKHLLASAAMRGVRRAREEVSSPGHTARAALASGRDPSERSSGAPAAADPDPTSVVRGTRVEPGRVQAVWEDGYLVTSDYPRGLRGNAGRRGGPGVGCGCTGSTPRLRAPNPRRPQELLPSLYRFVGRIPDTYSGVLARGRICKTCDRALIALPCE